MEKIDELRWIRVFTPDHIPTYLIEQIKNKDYTVEDFYKYHRMNLGSYENGQLKMNNFCHLYVLANDKNLVKGVLWMSIDPLTKDIIIQVFSMDKEYWGRGHAVRRLSDFVKDFQTKGKFNKIYWITNYEKHSMRYGFKRSKSILMEYDPKAEKKEKKNGQNSDGGNRLAGECGSSDTGTTELPEQPSGTAGGCSIADARTVSTAV